MPLGYDKLLPALKCRLPETDLELAGRAAGFVRRVRRITAPLFAWALVLSRFGCGRPGFRQAAQHFERLAGFGLFPRPFQMRVKQPQVVQFLARAFELAVEPWRSRRRPQHPLAQHFPDIVAWDATPVALHAALRSHFKGLRTAASQLKVLLAVSIFGQLPLAARLVAANIHDSCLPPPLELFRKGTLLLFDKGFATYGLLRLVQAAGMFCICPMRCHGCATVISVNNAPRRVRAALKRNPRGVQLKSLLDRSNRITKVWDLDVVVTPTGRNVDHSPVRTRLVIVPGPKGVQRRYMTNLDPCWSPSAIVELYRLRWQIELVFKELKQDLNLESVPTKDPYAAQAFVWASMTALAVSRTVCSALVPLRQLNGLASKIRPAVVTRALRVLLPLLARVLVWPAARAANAAELLLESIHLEAQRDGPPRLDSLHRLTSLVPAAP